MIFHAFYLPALLSVLLTVDEKELMGPTPPTEGGTLGFVENKYKMLAVLAGYELVFVYTGAGGYIYGLLQTMFAVLGYGAFIHYRFNVPADEALDSACKRDGTVLYCWKNHRWVLVERCRAVVPTLRS
jgi:hypothetical protein